MDYRQIAVRNENRLRNENERLKTLLYNALSLLKDNFGIDDTVTKVENTDLLDELGMTPEEYDKIMEE